MTNKEAIELLKKALGCVQTDHRNCGECKKCENYATKEDGIEAIRMAIAALEKAETNCPEIPDSWIPCSERLPEEGQEILATTVPNGWYDVVIIRTYYAMIHKSVIAWMPLPEPWKGE